MVTKAPAPHFRGDLKILVSISKGGADKNSTKRGRTKFKVGLSHSKNCFYLLY